MSEYFQTSASTSPAPIIPYISRRSPFFARSYMACTSQTLATSVATKILQKGGNCVHASIAAAAVLAVIEPCSTGIGGDMFALIWNESTKTVQGITGCGRLPKGSSLLSLPKDFDISKPTREGKFNANMVTVPGTARGWWDLYTRYCTSTSPDVLPGTPHTMLDLLTPAITMCREGVPIAGPITANAWRDGLKGQIQQFPELYEPNQCPLTVDGVNSPKMGELYKNEDLGNALEEIGKGYDNFYTGYIADKIVDTVQKLGGKMTKEDLSEHKSEWVNPISVDYMGKTLWEIPPPGQGVAGLIAVRNFKFVEDMKEEVLTSLEEKHGMIESMRVGFDVARKRVEDGAVIDVGEGLPKMRAEFNFDKSMVDGHPEKTSCTVSFQTYDSYGNSTSFVNSNYMGFGTGIVPPGAGFTLQNRGAGFNFEPGVVNEYKGGKRPYHTIIPAMVTENGAFKASISNMGGFMQPQGHLQLMVNLFKHNLNAQEAVDVPRFCIRDGTCNGVVCLEPGFGEEEELKAMGHKIVEGSRSLFGRAQVILKKENGVLEGGSDGRSDGCAMGF
ncbi:hypothetical protein TrLO_g5642 [Triparma laevis f. longispina]|uniref:Gamma-glutamyltransferase n=1 Tax=Triparma laevis f. longispina TaxID=1714387 RepID=A0A9W7CHT2_9STRA|nr:hypothetical protein TrLO_g5642 [Triparma laevis f. longispina]